MKAPCLTRGFRAKVKVSELDLRHRDLRTCEDNRGITSDAIVVEPAVAPAPPANTAAIEIEKVPIAARAAQCRTRKLHPRNSEVLVEKFQGHLPRLFIESLSDLGIRS